jgi:trehalose synthase
MDDIDENAHLVNAIQRHASVVVQKSLVEDFGLTVTEAMWKDKAIIASAVGGIMDQIADGEQGLLLQDPHDLPALGRHWVASCMTRSSRGGSVPRRTSGCSRASIGDGELESYVGLISTLSQGPAWSRSPARTT